MAKICPYHPKACEWVGTYRCTSACEYHPENYKIDLEVLEEFKKTPWAVYCLTCGKFLDSRGGHPEDHIIATGIAEYREKVPQFVMERLAGRAEETGDMNW
jgi:hypothetical protein